jgi:signal transduction histidine kinase
MIVNEDSAPTIPIEQHLADKLGELQQQLDSMRAQLTESQRLATIGTIAAVIAHEFNNLLTPIVSYSQFALQSAQSETPDMELIRKALGKSFQSADKAGKICQSMLGLARGQSSFGQVSVQTLIDEVLLVMARDPRKDGIALRIHVQPELHVHGDPIQLEQVLLNLLINARQAMLGRGGSLTVKASSGEDGQVRLQVIDTGPGIPEKLQTKIFEPFFTTKGTARKGEAKGTGLGLAICKEIIEHHKGRIEVQSEVGRGTTFNIYLPAA